MSIFYQLSKTCLLFFLFFICKEFLELVLLLKPRETMSNTKYVFVTGGVTSSLGKGIIAASLAKLLQQRGFSVTIQKLDPYINMNRNIEPV